MFTIWWSLKNKFTIMQTAFCGVTDIWYQYHPEQTTISTNPETMSRSVSNAGEIQRILSRESLIAADRQRSMTF
jgi:hypothetical protein